MTKLEVVNVTENGLKKAEKVITYILDGKDEKGITQEEFHAILDRAYQPIKKPQSDSKRP